MTIAKNTFGALTEAQNVEAESWHRPAVPVERKQTKENAVTCPFANGKYVDRDYDIDLEEFN